MAKIKNTSSNSHKTRPRGVKKHHFERVYWPYIPIVLAISLLLVINSGSGSLTAAMRHPFGNVLSYSTSMSLNGLLAATNSQRAANGVASLKLHGQLDAAAQAKADDMAARNYWSHNTPEGDAPWTFVAAQGYSYQKLGENLATGFNDEESTIDGWMASAPHKKNLLDSAFSEVGFGFANNPNYTSAGGGPMTIVVAFYGNPQVLSVSTNSTAPAAAENIAVPAAKTALKESVSAPASAAKTEPNEATAAPKKAAASDTPESEVVPAAATSRLQLAAPNNPYGAAATKAAVLLAVGLGLFWAARHLRALRRFLLLGESYAIRHPLTDLGIVIITGLLFIATQTVGLIQ